VDFEEIDGAVREFVTSVWFFASDPVATALRNCKKGDQLIVEARVIASNVVVERGGTDYDYAFDVISFRCVGEIYSLSTFVDLVLLGWIAQRRIEQSSAKPL
jgi:hypothetical protein